MRISCFLVFAVLLGGGSLFSASVPEMDMPSLVAGSPRIVHGEVVRRWTAWDESGRYIWTHTEIRVIEAVRGGAGRLVVSTPGGTIDGVTMHAPGATAFAEGEQAVVFAYPAPNGLWRLRGWSQGKYRVVETAAGGRAVRPALGSLNLVSGGDLKAATSVAAAAAVEESLPAFLERVRRLAAREGR